MKSPNKASLILLISIITSLGYSGCDGEKNIDQRLIGSWSSLQSGSLFNPATGDYYSGEMWTFKADGTYTNILVGSGQIISGVAQTKGKYTSVGNEIVLYHNRESFEPFPNDTTNKACKNKPVKDIRYYYYFSSGESVPELNLANSEFTDNPNDPHSYNLFYKYQPQK